MIPIPILKKKQIIVGVVSPTALARPWASPAAILGSIAKLASNRNILRIGQWHSHSGLENYRVCWHSLWCVFVIRLPCYSYIIARVLTGELPSGACWAYYCPYSVLVVQLRQPEFKCWFRWNQCRGTFGRETCASWRLGCGMTTHPAGDLSLIEGCGW